MPATLCFDCDRKVCTRASFCPRCKAPNCGLDDIFYGTSDDPLIIANWGRRVDDFRKLLYTNAQNSGVRSDRPLLIFENVSDVFGLLGCILSIIMFVSAMILGFLNGF